jgi:hypothetical protein
MIECTQEMTHRRHAAQLLEPIEGSVWQIV